MHFHYLQPEKKVRTKLRSLNSKEVRELFNENKGMQIISKHSTTTDNRTREYALVLCTAGLTDSKQHEFSSLLTCKKIHMSELH